MRHQCKMDGGFRDWPKTPSMADNGAFSVRPLRRPIAAGRLPGTVVVFIAAERRDLVGSSLAAFGDVFVIS